MDSAPRQVIVPQVTLHSVPEKTAAQETQLLFGETFFVQESKDGWVQGRAEVDSYEGWVEASALSDSIFVPTHRVSAVRAPVVTIADVKSPLRMILGMNALVRVEGEQGDFSKIGSSDWIFTKHLSLRAEKAQDWVAETEKFIGVSYLWGGRDGSMGVDCSGLIQAALIAAGLPCPRNSGEMARTLGEPIAIDPANLKRGDLVFWKGHVAVMLDAERTLHATDYSMTALVEPLTTTIERRLARGEGPITSIRRLD